jgi:phenylacetate-CoA ligase
MNTIFRLTLGFNKFPIKSALIEFDHIKESVNPQTKAKEIYQYHLTKTPFYISFIGKKNVSADIDWYQIPIIRKQDFQIDLTEILSQTNRKKLHIHNTSGSTGTPFYFAKDKFCHAMTWAYTDFRMMEHGINLGETLQARFYGIPLQELKYQKERLKDFLAGRVRFPVFNLSDSRLSMVLKEFKKRPFVYVNGYTSSLVVFAKYLIRSNIVLSDVCPTLQICMPTSEVCDDIDRATLEKGFGVKVVVEYGAAELDLIAVEDKDGDLVLNEETLYVEILDDEGNPVKPGEEGRVVVTALFNKAMPFIRYELGDRAILSSKIKNGRRVLEKVSGRINDIIYLPSGKVSPGLTFYYVSKKLLEGGGKIKEFIIRQKRPDLFVIEYTSEFELSRSDMDNCQRAMDIYLEPNLKLEFHKVSDIERGKSGKLKHFFSEL